MNKRKIFFLCAVFLCIYFELCVSGCTAIGFTIGYIRDKNTPPTESILYPEWEQLKPDTKIWIMTMDEDTLVGEFISVQRLPRAQAIEQYRLWYDSSTASKFLPSIEDTIDITMKQTYGLGDRQECRFYGVDLSSMWIRFKDRDTENPIPIKGIVEVSDRSGRKLSGDEIWKKIISREIPVPMTLRFRLNQRISDLPFGDISDIRVEVSRNAKWYGALIGLPLDALLIYLIHRLSDLQLWEVH